MNERKKEREREKESPISIDSNSSLHTFSVYAVILLSRNKLFIFYKYYFLLSVVEYSVHAKRIYR